MTADAPRSLDEAIDLAADAYLAALDERAPVAADSAPAAPPLQAVVST